VQYWTVPLEHFSAQASCVAILGLIKLKFHRLLGSMGRQAKVNNPPSYMNVMQLTDFNLLSEVKNLVVVSVSPPIDPADSSRGTLGTCQSLLSSGALPHVCAQQLPRQMSGRNPTQGNPTDTNINDMTSRSLLHLNPWPWPANEKHSTGDLRHFKGPLTQLSQILV
jgi:hypothetical protein